MALRSTPSNTITSNGGTIIGNTNFPNGINVYSERVAINDNSVKYYKLARVRFISTTGNPNGTYERALFNIKLYHTGDNLKIGNVKGYFYNGATKRSIHVTSFLMVINNSGSTGFSAGDILYFPLDSGSDSNDFIVDIYMKVTNNAKLYENTESATFENGCTLTIKPDGSTLISSLPVAGTTTTIDSITYTYGSSVNGIITSDLNSQVATIDNAIPKFSGTAGQLVGSTKLSINASDQLVSTITTGAGSPFVVSSTALVSNLNVDKVDGYDATDIIFSPVLPNKRGNVFSYKGLRDYINMIDIYSNFAPEVIAYAHGATAVANAYFGGVYSPTQNRIYLVPYAQANQATWHYVDCSTGNIVAYAHGATAVANAYTGGVYSPTQNRIYLAPLAQANQTNWHYVDCATGNVVAYAHGVTASSGAYYGCVYSPTQNRIYLVPFAQANQTNWHYIDCGTGNVVAYAHGITAVVSAYIGGVYSPTQNRIYLVPFAQANQTNWHYIDCGTGNVVAYAHGITAVANAYYGGEYSPIQNRIYLVPRDQANQISWHYIDCNTGTVVAYTHGVTALSGAYYGGVYSPTQNRLYLVPYSQANQTNWHYIDCNTSNVVAYAHGITAVGSGYIGGVYSPTQNRLYLVPYAQAAQTNWHYVDMGEATCSSRWLASHAMFNKF